VGSVFGLSIEMSSLGLVEAFEIHMPEPGRGGVEPDQTLPRSGAVAGRPRAGPVDYLIEDCHANPMGPIKPRHRNLRQ
jgi:hypothetical protein